MVGNSGMKHKSETMLVVIKGLSLDFVLYFTLLYYKVPFIYNFNTENNIKYIINHLMSTKCLLIIFVIS